MVRDTLFRPDQHTISKGSAKARKVMEMYLGLTHDVLALDDFRDVIGYGRVRAYIGTSVYLGG